MRIAQIATCNGPVREDRTGSVEALIWLLSRELLALGHEVTVFACAGSEVPGAEIVATHPGSYGEPGTPADWQLCDLMTLCRAIEQSHRFDVMHTHNYLWGLPVEGFSKCPMIHTMHTCPYDDEAVLWDRYPNARITAVSDSQWRGISARQPAAVIHHGVDPAHFTYRAKPDEYVCYLGRFIAGKGPLAAIRIARELDVSLVIAGPANEYFEAEVRPHVDGVKVRHVGFVDSAGRSALLGGAKALLYPLRDPEPFGLVQIEAMMCGTPVVAPAIGAIPEIIDDGITGRVVSNVEDMTAAAREAFGLPRSTVRQTAERRFSASAMAARYQATYAAALHQART